MKTRKIALTGIQLSIVFCSMAIQIDSTSIKGDSIKPFQVTFISPLGTNGYLSPKSTNYLSLNVIAGYNGGLEGIEIGGVTNVLEHNMTGMQIAGFANVVREDMEGIQIAGFSNMTNGNTEGIMISGFSNMAMKGGNIIQMAGFSNQSMAATKGPQLAGFANIAVDSIQGFQVAGFSNFSGKESEVTQIAGFVNATKGNVTGAQIAGLANVAKDVSGAQISGFINSPRKFEGIQLGIINVADTFSKGAPIGLFSHVIHGYRSLQLTVNDMQWIEAQYHTGVNRFYNIFSLGVAPIPGSEGWSFGYGIGTSVYNTRKSNISLNLTAHHVNEQSFFTEALNSVIKFTPTYSFHPSSGSFAITAGPSINLLIQSNEDWYGEQFKSNTAPYAILEGKTISPRKNFGLEDK